MQPIDDKFVCSTVCAQRLQKITKLNNYAMSVYGIDKSKGSQKVGLRSHVCPAGKHFSHSYDTKAKAHVKGSCKKHKGKKSGKKSAKKQSRK